MILINLDTADMLMARRAIRAPLAELHEAAALCPSFRAGAELRLECRSTAPCGPICVRPLIILQNTPKVSRKSAENKSTAIDGRMFAGANKAVALSPDLG